MYAREQVFEFAAFLWGDWEVIVLRAPVEVVEARFGFTGFAAAQGLTDVEQAQFAAIDVTSRSEQRKVDLEIGPVDLRLVALHGGQVFAGSQSESGCSIA